ncbi:E3 binding domain-containing protein [Streptomyces sp. ET3-23]|uniref:E3 binding domain-containing protein n=1 Tax=Streptomyces sp. ET3-23 TaxID=2885643 RepID=UPI001D100672|nr:E3 binding domain-containing protein [Streptomyces sp. ET3-23]MCC2274410.1 E3 binding domain-containing protein [Streptomyces sp. ET3-23]
MCAVRLGSRPGGLGGTITRADIARAAEARTRTPSRLRATPLARRLAAELGIDIRHITGSGPDGAVRAADVRTAAEVPGPPRPTAGREKAGAAAGAEETRAAAMRHAIGDLMSRSKREIPHYSFRDTLELDSLDFLRLVETLGDRTGCRIDEDDYPAFTTLSGATGFLVEHAP